MTARARRRDPSFRSTRARPRRVSIRSSPRTLRADSSSSGATPTAPTRTASASTRRERRPARRSRWRASFRESASDAAGDFVVVSSELHTPLIGRPISRQRRGPAISTRAARRSGSQFVVTSFAAGFDNYNNYIVDYPSERAIARSSERSVHRRLGLRGVPHSRGRPPHFGHAARRLRPAILEDGREGRSGDCRSRPPTPRRSPRSPRTRSATSSSSGRAIPRTAADAASAASASTLRARESAPEFQVNTYTTGDQTTPSVAIDETGDFVVVWESAGQDGACSGVFGARFDRHGTRLGTEFQVNVHTTDDQQLARVASDGRGFVAVWESANQDGDGFGVFGTRQNLRDRIAHGRRGLAVRNVLRPRTASSSPARRCSSRRSGETRPTRRSTVTGNAPTAPCAPGTTCVTPTDGSADYGTIAAGEAKDCSDASPDACYRVSASGPRPGTHWDGDVRRDPVDRRRRGLDAPRRRQLLGRAAHAALLQEDRDAAPHRNHARAARRRRTVRATVVSRDQMAIFIAKGIAGGGRARAGHGPGRRERVQLHLRRHLALHRRRADRHVLQARPLPRRAERDPRLQRQRSTARDRR